jgi:hypothetical protein
MERKILTLNQWLKRIDITTAMVTNIKQVFLGVTLLVCALVISGCLEQVRPHEPVPGDLYCVYTVTASRGGGAIPVGGTICIYCPPPPANTCKQKRTITPAPGIEYDLSTTNRSCLSCPSKHTYELK